MKTLYVHIPFCGKKCFYCSFVVSVGQEQRINAYLEGLEAEAKHYNGEPVESVYIGGGTPTRLSREELGRLFRVIRKYFLIMDQAEWTVESNPEGLDTGKLAALRNGGVNRISLGVQSLSDKYLNYLGRNHDASAALAAYDRIKKAGFDNVNIDLMFAFPGQTMSELKKDVNEVIRLESDHLSLYTLTVEENSRFYARHIQLGDDRQQAEQYLIVCDMLGNAGFKQYEVSNFAKPAKKSQHNLHYWCGGEYIGLGVGAHSYIDGQRFWNMSKLNDYLSSVQEGASVRQGFENLTLLDQMNEVLLFGLRMNQGVCLEKIKERFGRSLSDDQMRHINSFVENEFLIEENGFLKASPQGRLLLDELCAYLIN